jgi:HSP20 family protein
MFSLMPWRKERSEVAPRIRSNDPLSLFRGEFDALFDRFFVAWPTLLPEVPMGAKLEETDKEFVYQIDAPGFEAKDFNIELTADELKISAEHKEDKGDGKEVSTRQMKHYLSMPANADTEKVEARYHSGVLELRVGKSPEAQAKKIEVKA